MKTWAGRVAGLLLFILSYVFVLNRPALTVETIKICPAAQLAVDVPLYELPQADIEIEDSIKFCGFEYLSMKKAARLGRSTAFLDLVGKTAGGITLKTSLSIANPFLYSVKSFSTKNDQLLVVYGLEVWQVLIALVLAAFFSALALWGVEYVVGEIIKKRTTKET